MREVIAVSLSKRAQVFALVAILWTLLACGVFPAEQLPPDEILARASKRMAGLAGFEFTVDRSGAPAFLNPQESIAFRRAEGKYAAPNRVYTKVRVIAPGVVAEVELINIAGAQWETNLLTGEWQVSDTRYVFNPNLLFDPEKGIPYVLASQLTDAVFAGMEEIEEVPGKQLYAVTANLAGGSAYQMTYGLIDEDPLKVKVWVEPKTFNVFRVILEDPPLNGEEEATVWQIDFWSFDAQYDIQQPALK